MMSTSAEAGSDRGHADSRPSVPVTGEQYELSAGDYRAVVTGLGAGLRELSHAGRPYSPATRRTSRRRVPPASCLAPVAEPRRPRALRLRGRDHQLDLSEAKNGNAIHGLTRWAAWEPVRHEPDRVVIRHPPHGHAGYPFAWRSTPSTG